MKVIVQIPCYNEEATLPQTVAAIPSQIDGVTAIEILVVDDGSTDRTAEVARDLGVDHIVRHRRNCGLAQAFATGIDASLKCGADIIVNTDGDNQYEGSDIAKLVEPILSGRADVVIGDRQTAMSDEFSWSKRLLQRLGSFVVRRLSDLDVPDAVSGFRAISRDAAMKLNFVSRFSYTIEMLIQAGRKQMAVTSVVVATNPETRKSRLYRNLPSFIWQSLKTMARIYVMYQPLRVYVLLGSLLTLVGLVPMIRFLFLFFSEEGEGHIQSLVLGGVFLILGFLTFAIGVIADLINFNRQLMETALEKVRQIELDRDRSA